MELIETLIGKFFSLLPWQAALIIFCIVTIWTAYELSAFWTETHSIQKVFRLGRAALIALVGSLFSGFYIDGIDYFPFSASWKISLFFIIVLSFILKYSFFRERSEQLL